MRHQSIILAALCRLVPCVLIGAISLPSSAAPAAAPAQDSEINRKVKDLLRQMTIEEKVGQLSQIGGIAFIPDKISIDERVRRGHAGSILWLSDPKAINQLQHIAVEKTRLHIPLIFGFDVIHGFRTIFPVPIAMAASWDPSVEGPDRRRAGGQRRRHQLGVRAHARHRT